MSILCLGPKASGKTLLLNALQDEDAVNDTTHSISTVGTNIFTIKLPPSESELMKKPNAQPKIIEIRELGGIMAPMWKNYYSEDVIKVMYVVDTSNLCQISAAGVLLYSILSEPKLQNIRLIIILTKMDFSYRQMRNEALLMMQMRELEKQVNQKITIVQASAIDNEGLDEIKEWLAKK